MSVVAILATFQFITLGLNAVKSVSWRSWVIIDKSKLRP